ncbi:hypothetical protein GJ496_002359 [Pomphorhynchus laevis]|nr:hypothetical protein GJ496_002359 [Pomphorhynchus laevis]
MIKLHGIRPFILCITNNVQYCKSRVPKLEELQAKSHLTSDDILKMRRLLLKSKLKNKIPISRVDIPNEDLLSFKKTNLMFTGLHITNFCLSVFILTIVYFSIKNRYNKNKHSPNQ